MSEKTSKQRKQDTIVITILILCSLFITFPDDVDNLVMDEKYDDVQVYVIMETSADYRGKGNNRIMTAEEFCCSSRSLLTILQKRGVLTRSWYLSCEREFIDSQSNKYNEAMFRKVAYAWREVIGEIILKKPVDTVYIPNSIYVTSKNKWYKLTVWEHILGHFKDKKREKLLDLCKLKAPIPIGR